MSEFERLQHPVYTKSQLESLNPALLKGEEVYESDDEAPDIPKRMKVGPGRYNDLPYNSSSSYASVLPVTNQIGDVKTIDDINGKSATEILELMLSPYQPVVVSSLQNNLAGSYKFVGVKEVGQSISGAFQLKFGISNSENLVEENSLEIKLSSLISDSGLRNYANPLTVNLTEAYQPTENTRISFGIRSYHLKGVTGYIYTYLDFLPRIIWGVSQSSYIDEAGVNNLTGKQFLITDNPKREYTYTFSGYPWLAIPAMIDPGNLLFLDYTIPSLPAPYGMILKKSITVNNGVGSYLYNLYTTINKLDSSSRLKVS